MQEVEPNDKIVRTAIIKAVSKVDSNIRPNKLRKIICKDVEGTNWTQYQRVLDLLIEEKKLKTTMINKELSICPLSDTSNNMKDSSTKSNGHDEKDTSLDSSGESSSHGTKMKIPLAIVYHLIKKGQKKLKSLELNSKTKFTFSEVSLSAVKKKDFDINEETTFIIKSHDDGGDEEVAKKHIKTAKLYVSKMDKAFKVNPERFCRRKAGGTMKEQQEAKKMKHDAVQKKKKKISTQNNDRDKKEGATSQPKKKRRKFY